MTDRATVRDVAFAAAVGLLSISAFASAFQGTSGLRAALVGLVAGLAVAVAGVRLRLPAAIVALPAAGAGLVLGGLALPATAIAGVITGRSTIAVLAEGAIRGWKDLLTGPVPTGRPVALVAAYLCTLLGGVVTCSVALRTRRAWTPAPPALAFVAAGLLLGPGDAPWPVARAVAVAVLVLGWTAARAPRRVVVGEQRRGLGLLSAAAAAAVLSACAVAAALLGPALPGSGTPPFVLREHVVPPFDPAAFPSPLGAIRHMLTAQRDATLFTVTGAPAGSRVRLAGMDSYDGTVWNVAGGPGSPASSGRFDPVSGQVGGLPARRVPGPRVHVSLTVGSYRGVWLPTVGVPTSLTVAGSRSRVVADSLRFNAATGTGVVPAGLAPGDTVELDAVLPPAPTPATLTGAPVAKVSQPVVRQNPPAVAQSLPQLLAAGGLQAAASDGQPAGAASDPWRRVAALTSGLRTGYYSHGETGNAPSAPGHSSARLTTFLRPPLVGDEEQYAAAAALLLRDAGVPSRVVLGWVVQGEGAFHATGGSASAWVEVLRPDGTWVPVDVTPDRDRRYRVPPEQVRRRELPRPPVPPVAVPVTAVPPPQAEVEDADRGPKSPGPGLHVPRAVLVAAAGIGAPTLVTGGTALLLTGVKVRRRRRRRRAGPPQARVEAGWDEVLDLARDLGHPVAAAATRREAARALGGAPETEVLARRADEAAFAGVALSAVEAEAFWADVEDYLRRQRGQVGRRRRLAAAVTPTSLHRARTRRRTGEPAGRGLGHGIAARTRSRLRSRG